ncbi:MAG TPA: FAD-binding oxidoreductase [Gemmatimonadaceae bacterium]|nr:FAD-binding oxidoreductase [Gemmatimonadaceae bacterium]
MIPSGFRGLYREDEDARAVYSEAAGIGRAIPIAVAVPADPDDVVTLVKWAATTRTPLVPRGSGSSMAGGAIGNGVVVDLTRLNHLSTINESSRRVWADPGVLWSTLDSAARKKGLRLPVDPSSGSFCTLGGMVSTNAAGARSLKYGSTAKWVHALDCVFSDGERGVITRGEEAPRALETVRRFLRDGHAAIVSSDARHPARHKDVRKESSGYRIHAYAEKADLIELLLGSEGTLAIIVGIQLGLAPVPAATSSVLGSFASLDDAAAAAQKAADAGASACELLDRTFLDYAAQAKEGNPRTLGLITGAEAILLAEVEAETSGEASDAATRLGAAFKAAGASRVELALTSEAEHELWDLRHAASPILSTIENLVSMQFIEDGAVPLAKLPEYIKGVRQALDARKISGVIFGHAGDGHIHVNPLIDVRAPQWREKIQQLLDDVVTLTSRLGGTLSGEHGDGSLRAPLLKRVWHKDSVEAFGALKKAFDPQNIFNPGVKVPLLNQRALTDIKYDPSLPALSEAARKALDDVVSQRAYNRFRLSLVESPS